MFQPVTASLPDFDRNMSNADYQQRLRTIRKKIQPYKNNRPSSSKSGKTICEKRNKTCHDADFIRDYSGVMLADVLNTIRNKQPDYVFHEDQVIEILRYEPKTIIKYLGDSIWQLSLPKRRRNKI